MIHGNRPSARIANWLIAHAERHLPATRREWGQAMRRELEQIEEPSTSLKWALGCVVASYSERVNAMNRGDLRISGWVLGFESMTCFGPLTLLWIASLFNMNRLIYEPGIVFVVALSTVAPFSLLLSLLFITTGRRINPKWHIAFMCGFAVFGILQVISRIGSQGPRFTWFTADAGLVLLFWVLPALCSLHLSLITRRA